MSVENRFYKFSDEQVQQLGFSSYEELAQYYDVLFCYMAKGIPCNKKMCVSELKNMGIENRINYSEQDRLKSSVQDNINAIMNWEDPSMEEIRSMKFVVAQSLSSYFAFLERAAKSKYLLTSESLHK